MRGCLFSHRERVSVSFRSRARLFALLGRLLASALGARRGEAATAARHRVRHRVAKSRHVILPALPSCSSFIHCDAHRRIRSRGARGSDGGGVDVSSGGSSGGGWLGGSVTGGGDAGACGSRGRRGGKGAPARPRCVAAGASPCAKRDGAGSADASVRQHSEAATAAQRQGPRRARENAPISPAIDRLAIGSRCGVPSPRRL